MTLRLGVNVDHVATLRNARGTAYPDPVAAALVCLGAGADGITAHLREDRRHIRDADVDKLATTPGLRLNLEMAATAEMIGIATRLRPAACCLVPEKRTEVTTEGGLDAAGLHNTLGPQVAALRDAGIRVSLFVDPDARQLEAAVSLGAPVVELHTGAYAEGKPGELDRLRQAAALAARLGLEPHAGHGLTYGNVGPIAAIPEVAELNIGHFLVAQSVFAGLPAVVARMRAIMLAVRTPA